MCHGLGCSTAVGKLSSGSRPNPTSKPVLLLGAPAQVEGAPPPPAGSPDYFNYNDTYGHGTHTAGIIGAVSGTSVCVLYLHRHGVPACLPSRAPPAPSCSCLSPPSPSQNKPEPIGEQVGNNAVGVAGVTWNVKLLVCRFIWNDGSGYVSDAMNCIKLCKQEGALITSNSWGGIGYSSAWRMQGWMGWGWLGGGCLRYACTSPTTSTSTPTSPSTHLYLHLHRPPPTASPSTSTHTPLAFPFCRR